ncbi:hypothetical protein [Candidatus Methanoperedens nitratireducens]|uniref:Uncharacterized protein n=1 Tax=Candidatus Methanoperedens nitratireducens TaxID=1392998 RepID=A0A284VK40_9EURY|nr:hypothetical protein [Candidatus Methanoperedens nitroreducens]SNQ59623.1 hypothetical protein MNV_1250003 [Candidatus Methanoperedens nitroreducens]
MKIALNGYILVFVVIFYFISIVSAQTDKSIESEKIIGNVTNEQNLSNQSYNIKVVLDHIFISKKNNSLEISEIVIFRNEGPEIYYTRDNHTFFAISTPQDIKNLRTQAMECCLVQEEGVVFMDPMQPIKPGDNFEMQVSYMLPSQNSEYVFNKSAVYNTTSLLFLVDKKSGLNLEGLYETLTLAGNEYNVITFNNLKAGETASIPIKITQERNYLYAVIGLISLFLIGLVYRFKDKILGKVGKAYTLEELELEKIRIFQTIHGFEKHAGADSSEEYRRLMEEYREKAIEIFIKIDKLRNKN